MTLEDLRCMSSLLEFKNYGISVADYYKLPDYYENYLKNKSTMRVYTQFNSYLMGTSDKRFKFIEVEIGNDVVCVFFRCIDYFKAHSLKLHGIPVSRDGNIENVFKVIKVLFEKDFYCSIVVDTEDLGILGIKGNLKRAYNVDNYFSSYEYLTSKYTHKYLQSKRMLNLDRECTPKITKNKDEVLYDILKIEDLWEELYDGNIRERKAFRRFMKFSADDLVYFVLYVGDVPLSYEIFIIDGCRAVDLFGKNICRIDDIETYSGGVFRKRDIMNLTLYSQYRSDCCLYDMFGIRTFYLLGSGNMMTGSVDPLLEFKRKNNEGYVEYFLLDKNNYKL